MINLPTDLKTEFFEGQDALIKKDLLGLDDYAAVLLQNQLSLLGRNLDVSKFFANIMNHHMRCSIDAAISRYEASDITYILELETLIEASRLTHKLLSKYLELDSFDVILKEVDESLDLQEPNGRILSHSIHLIICDLIPNFCYNSMTNRYNSFKFQIDPQLRILCTNFSEIRFAKNSLNLFVRIQRDFHWLSGLLYTFQKFYRRMPH